MDADEGQQFVSRGDVLQIAPDCPTNPGFGACFLTVTEVRSWGVIGYVQALGTREGPGGQAFIRLKWDEVELTGGVAPFVRADEGALIEAAKES